MNKSILRIGFKPLNLINKLKKKDEHLVFFYSNLGFRDNVKALYNYLIENKYNNKYKIVVSINDYKKYLGKEPKNVEFVSNKQGIGIFMKAKYAFYCFGKYPIKPSKKQVVVNLWHGTPLKKIGNLEKGLEKIDYNYFSTVITNSKVHLPIMMKIFGCKKAQVEVFGYPRNDELFKSDIEVDKKIRGKSHKIILWLPTYREYDSAFLISVLDEESLRKLNAFLEKNKCKLIIKLHPLQRIDISKEDYKNIEFINESKLHKEGIDVYELLRNADGLITDYSSVYFDYLLLDRPIAFAVADIARYKNERGFVFEKPEKYMPGISVETLDDIEVFINNVIQGKDDFREKRTMVNEDINYYKDGKNCERIVERFLG